MNTTPKLVLLAVLATGTIAFGLARSAPVAGQTDATDQAKIADAMKAGPAAITKDATILDHKQDAAGNLVVLRQGSNGWTCLPDNPGSPTDDPMCLDATWVGWLKGLLANKVPVIKEPGIGYMLQGESDASNADPMATKPAPGDDWVVSPPHIMILQPQKLDQSVFSTDPKSGGPWIMWPGTPYEHIMMPVGPEKAGS